MALRMKRGRTQKLSPFAKKVRLVKASFNPLLLAQIRNRRQGPEKKAIDVAPASYVADTTGTVTLLNGVATGTDFTDRIGRKTQNISLQIQGIVNPVDNTCGPTLARLIVVYDAQPNGAAPVVTDVLKTADSASQLNLNNRDRFKVLWDKRYPIGISDNVAGAIYVGAPTSHEVNLWRTLNFETLYNGTGATVASIGTGSIYMITIGNQAAGVGASFYLSSRIRFIDS